MRVVLGCAVLVAMAGMAGADELPTQTTEPTEPEAPPPPAEAPPKQPDSFDRPALRPLVRTKEIVVEVPGERTRNQKIVLGSVAALGVLFGGIAFKYHLDSRDAADAVSADVFTGRPWSPALQAEVDRAADARGVATIGYSIGGALLLGVAVAWIVTEPKATREVMRPHLSLANGGASVGGTWSW
jgi:hypothetical protein